MHIRWQTDEAHQLSDHTDSYLPAISRDGLSRRQESQRRGALQEDVSGRPDRAAATGPSHAAQPQTAEPPSSILGWLVVGPHSSHATVLGCYPWTVLEIENIMSNVEVPADLGTSRRSFQRPQIDNETQIRCQLVAEAVDQCLGHDGVPVGVGHRVPAVLPTVV
jgi:hypothetical protein